MSKTNEKQLHSAYDDVFTGVPFFSITNTDISETLIG